MYFSYLSMTGTKLFKVIQIILVIMNPVSDYFPSEEFNKYRNKGRKISSGIQVFKYCHG